MEKKYIFVAILVCVFSVVALMVSGPSEKHAEKQYEKRTNK